MRNVKLLFLSYAFLITLSCKKELKQDSRKLSIKEAKCYFEENVLPNSQFQRAAITNNFSPRKDTRKPIWDKAYTIHSDFGHDVIVVPLAYANPFFLEINEFFSAKDLIRLMIYQDSNGQYHTELITLLPKNGKVTSKNGGFDGVVLVEDWNGNAVKILEYKHGVVEKSFKSTSAARVEVGVWYRYEMKGYNYSPESGDYYGWTEVVYVYVETSDYSNSYYGNSQSHEAIDYGDAYGGGPINIEPENLDMFAIAYPERPIGNIADYLKCFDNNPSTDHKYTVSICVAQPNPGTRDTWAFRSANQAIEAGNPVLVGHTFIMLSEQTPSKTIVRNVGLYPANFVSPTSPATQGVLGNDEQHEYNIMLTVSLSSSEFNNVVNYISEGYSGAFTYNLNTNNCTTFAANAMAAGHIVLPRTFGTWTNGSGMNPGDMGEDVRALSLSSNMVRNTAANDHPNTGNCY